MLYMIPIILIFCKINHYKNLILIFNFYLEINKIILFLNNCY